MTHIPRKVLLLTLVAIAAFIVGCDNKQTTSQQIETLKTDTREAAQDLKDQNFSYGQKAEFAAKMEKEVGEINKSLDQLAAKIELSSDSVKAEAKPKLEALRAQAADLNKQLDAARNATVSTWDSVKAGTQKSYDALKGSFAESRQWISDKIAP